MIGKNGIARFSGRGRRINDLPETIDRARVLWVMQLAASSARDVSGAGSHAAIDTADRDSLPERFTKIHAEISAREVEGDMRLPNDDSSREPLLPSVEAPFSRHGPGSCFS